MFSIRGQLNVPLPNTTIINKEICRFYFLKNGIVNFLLDFMLFKSVGRRKCSNKTKTSKSTYRKQLVVWGGG